MAMLGEISATETAVTGLMAQRVRMNVIANNIANVGSTRTASGGAFRRQMAIFKGEQLQPGIRPDRFGVKVSRIVDDPSPFKRVFEPQHPDADADGYVEYPNIDVFTEMANLVSAQRGYEANIAVIVSGKQITQKAMELLQA